MIRLAVTNQTHGKHGFSRFSLSKAGGSCEMKRIVAFVYGVACYCAFLATLVIAVGFLGNIGVPNSIDAPADGPPWRALAIDAGLLALFAVQHSVMARPWFKRAWTRVVPQPVERSTYVLFSSAALLVMFWKWQPVAGVIWDVRGGLAEAVVLGTYAAGLLIVLLSTFLIDHFDLFGMRQVYLYLRRRPYVHSAFRTPLFYRYVRHPLYVGWLLTFWAAPLMTSAHLFFALMTTAYILIAIRFEEHDLTTLHGDKYRRYREQVPMIIPSVSPRASKDTGAGETRVAASA
jgi:methanethiol S-methyltransferase